MFIKRLTVGEFATNCYLVGCEEKSEALVMDPGAEAGKILAELALCGWELKKVVLTHAHFDHFGAAAEILAQYNVPLLIGEADGRGLEDPGLNLAGFFGDCKQSLKADELLAEGQKVEIGALEFTVLHTPGHTPGSICLLGGDVLFTGDTLFAGSCGRTDLPGGSMSMLQESLRRLASLPENLQVLPGHGPSSTIGQELAVNPFLG
jgi:glyoxylase-like metal-dependent hydrolase (beta-lactamase superfamily II)